MSVVYVPSEDALPIWFTRAFAPGMTAQQLIDEARQAHPDIDAFQGVVGVFSLPLDGRRLPPPDEYVLRPGDRVECYRPITESALARLRQPPSAPLRSPE